METLKDAYSSRIAESTKRSATRHTGCFIIATMKFMRRSRFVFFLAVVAVCLAPAAAVYACDSCLDHPCCEKSRVNSTRFVEKAAGSLLAIGANQETGPDEGVERICDHWEPSYVLSAQPLQPPLRI